MKIKEFLWGGYSMLLIALSLVGCSDYDNGFTEKQIAFQQAFREQFGDIDPNHTWSTVTRSTLTVGVDMPGFDDPYTVRVYTANPRGKVSNCYLLGQWTADSPSPHDYVFDMPAGLKTVWVAVTKQNGGRYVQQARIVDHKCTANFTLSSGAYGKTRAASDIKVNEPDGAWEYFKREKYYNKDYDPEKSSIEDAGFIQIYPEDDVDYESGICTDFEIVVTGTDPIKMTHFYSNTDANDPVLFFVYRPDDGETLEEAYADKSRHMVLCEHASDHVLHYKPNSATQPFEESWIKNGSGIDKMVRGDADAAYTLDAVKKERCEGNTDAIDAIMRGKQLTITGLQRGDHIVFYLSWYNEKRNYQDNKAATRAILNEKSTAFAGVLNYGHRTYIGFEDALGFDPAYSDKPNGYYDLNDVVYILEGDFTVEDHEDELSRDMSYIVAYEDLGASEDFDFNDIVLKVSRVSGTQKVNLSVLAAGGTLPVSIYHTRNGREELFTDVHKLFGVETETVINAYPGRHTEYTPIRKSIELESGVDLDFSKLSIRVTQKDGQTYGIHAPQYYDIPASDDTYIGKEDEEKNPLNVPYAILIADPTWDWPDEGVSIAARYSEFIDWVKDADRTNWYRSKWKEGEGGSGEEDPNPGPNNPGDPNIGITQNTPFEIVYDEYTKQSWTGSFIDFSKYKIPEGYTTGFLMIKWDSNDATYDNIGYAYKNGAEVPMPPKENCQRTDTSVSIPMSSELLQSIIDKGGFYIGRYDNGSGVTFNVTSVAITVE